VSGSGISWDICKSAPSSRQITMPAPHHSIFLQAGICTTHDKVNIKLLGYSTALLSVKTATGKAP